MQSHNVTSAKQIKEENGTTWKAMNRIVQRLSSENKEPDRADYRYGKKTDKRNYYNVNDVFAYRSIKDELARYVRNYQ